MKFVRRVTEAELGNARLEMWRVSLWTYIAYLFLVLLTSTAFGPSVIPLLREATLSSVGLALLYPILPAVAVRELIGLAKGWPIGLYAGGLWTSLWIDRNTVLGVLGSVLVTPFYIFVLYALTALLFGINPLPGEIAL